MIEDVLFEKRGALGLITLNRPKALNALTRDMALAMKTQLDAWAGDVEVETVVVQGAGDRAFCAGGDIRSLYESGRAGTPYALDFYRDEYILDAAIKHYPKPYVALIAGIVMGGGVGVSVHGSHRVADETTTFAMPETGIGLFPDVGGSFFLARAPGEVGMYLALTGARLKTADCLYAGIATHFVAKDKRATLVERLADGMTPDAALGELHEDVPGTFLDSHRKSIDAIFGKSSVDELLVALDADHTDWSRDTAKTIRAKSPTSIRLTFRQLREGARLSFDDCLRMEYRMVHGIVAGHDFYEGVRATIIDKDGAPRWDPATLAEVSDAAIDAYFAPITKEFAAMRRLILSILAVILATSGAADALRKMSEKEMKQAADVVVTGRVIAIGFAHNQEFAAVGIESVQKGAPARPLSVLLNPAIAEEDPACCNSGGRYRMYLRRLPNGMYQSVDGRYGMVELNSSP